MSLAAVICVSGGFVGGDLAEEWCWPLSLWSMYAAPRAWREGTPISLRGFFAHGILVGYVLWIKFNQLAPHFVFMAMLAIEAVIEDKGVVRALRMCGVFLLGMYLIENIFGYALRQRSNSGVIYCESTCFVYCDSLL